MRPKKHKATGSNDLCSGRGWVRRIDALFDIERGINGLAADERLRIRKQQSEPLLAELETRLREQRSRMSRSASVAGPIDYMLKRWDWFARFIGDGRVCLTNNAAERALRGFAKLESLCNPSSSVCKLKIQAPKALSIPEIGESTSDPLAFVR